MDITFLFDIFDLPLERCSHITSIIKQIAKLYGYSYSRYKRYVYEILSNTDIGKLWTRRRRIYRVLRDYGKADQRSDAWLQKRSEMITASEVTKAFQNATPSARYELLLSKVRPKEAGMQGAIAACMWGTQFEPIVKEIYGALREAEVVDTTCVRHPVYPFIGASPDGIVLTHDSLDSNWGKLVEFKCPISRKFSQESSIPDYYYHQMQLQMECTGIDECDYVEAQFKTCTQTQYKESNATHKGMFAVYDSGRVDYNPSTQDFRVWKDTLQGDEYRIVYWTLEQLCIKPVKRDFQWMANHLQELQSFWKIVEECRADPLKMDQYKPQTAQRGGPCETLLVDVQSPELVADLFAGHTMKLRLDV